MSDVIVVGGGVIGLSAAWELASHGATVKIIDQRMIGQEASWAGAGMLPPGNLAGETSGEGRLRALSCELWAEWTQSLREATGIDNGYQNCGANTKYRLIAVCWMKQTHGKHPVTELSC